MSGHVPNARPLASRECPKHAGETIGYCVPCETTETPEARACREYREMTGAAYCDVPCRPCDERAAWLNEEKAS